MRLLEKILWAVDIDQDLAEFAKKIAIFGDQFGSDIIILHVLPDDLEKSSFGGIVLRSVEKELDELRNQILAIKKIDVVTKTEFGNIVDTIIDVSVKENVNTIVLNGKKNKDEVKGLAGMNATKVIRYSKKPVALLSSKPIVNEHVIVCPVDCSEASSVALADAIIHAKKAASELHIISVFSPIEVSSTRLSSLSSEADMENSKNLVIYRKNFEEFVAGFNLNGLKVTKEVLVGEPHMEIVKYSKDANMLYIGSSGKSGLRRVLLGSVAEKVANNVTCSVVYTKAEENFKLKLPTEVKDIESYYALGNQLVKLGYYEEAIEQYTNCMEINDMHIPSVIALLKLYEKLGNKSMSDYYKDIYKVIKEQLLNWKIEEEIRRNISL